MNYKTFFKVKVYKFLYYKYVPFYKGAVKKKIVQKSPRTLRDIISLLNDDSFENLVLVASGPSSKKLILSDKDLYLCTNNSIELVKSKKIIYYIQDYYFTLRYLKKHFKEKNWKATFCIVNENDFKGNRDVFKAVNKYLTQWKRNKNEYLISDIEKKEPYCSHYNELNDYLKKEFNTEFISLNSGFSMLMLITYMADVLNKRVKIYGLDFGLGGYEYFDGTKIDEHCSYNDFSKEKAKQFLRKIYLNENILVENHSYFQTMKSV